MQKKRKRGKKEEKTKPNQFLQDLLLPSDINGMIEDYINFHPIAEKLTLNYLPYILPERMKEIIDMEKMIDSSTKNIEIAVEFIRKADQTNYPWNIKLFNKESQQAQLSEIKYEILTSFGSKRYDINDFSESWCIYATEFYPMFRDMFEFVFSNLSNQCACKRNHDFKYFVEGQQRYNLEKQFFKDLIEFSLK